MILFPCAKINLGLHITSKRADGYHNLQTLFYPISGLCDLLEIVPAEGIGTPLWEGTPPKEDNLITKAYRAVQRLKPNLPSVNMALRKNIPIGAGMGGGSSDATATVLALNKLFELQLSDLELRAITTSIGADCPFFLNNKPQIAEGIGEILTPYPLNLNGWFITLLFPNIQISTKEAYAKIKPKMPEEDIRQTLTRPIEEWKSYLTNDFEDPIFKQYPNLKELKEELYKEGATYASMSGSGSTIFAIGKKAFSLKHYNCRHHVLKL